MTNNLIRRAGQFGALSVAALLTAGHGATAVAHPGHGVMSSGSPLHLIQPGHNFEIGVVVAVTTVTLLGLAGLAAYRAAYRQQNATLPERLG